MRNSVRKLLHASSILSNNTAAAAAAFGDPTASLSAVEAAGLVAHLPTSASSSAPGAASSSSASEKIIWGSNIRKLFDNFVDSTADAVSVITSPGQGKSQPLPADVLAGVVMRLLREGNMVQAIDITLSRPFTADRGVLIETIGHLATSEDWGAAWAYVKLLHSIENGHILRATLAIAFKSFQEDIIEEALRYVVSVCRRHKTLAGEVLRPYCVMLPVKRWTEGQEMLEFAQQSGAYFDISQIDALLWLMIAARQHKRVLATWGWIKNTTAGNNSSIVSAVIVALTREHQRLTDVLALMQHLARLELDPLPEAQIATIELMSKMRKPNPVYASELINYWRPVDGATSMRLNLAVAFAFAKIDTPESIVSSAYCIAKIASDPAQVSTMRPNSIVSIAPLLVKHAKGIEALETLSAAICAGCKQRVSLEGFGVVLALAALSVSESMFYKALNSLRDVLCDELFDFNAATAESASSSLSYSQSVSSYRGDSGIFGGGGTGSIIGSTLDDPSAFATSSGSGVTPSALRGSREDLFASSDDAEAFAAPSSSSSSAPSNEASTSDGDSTTTSATPSSSSPAQKAFDFVCREMFASLKAVNFGKGRIVASRLAEELTNPISLSNSSGKATEPTAEERVFFAQEYASLPVVVPKDSSEWFALISNAEHDDASVILEELGA